MRPFLSQKLDTIVKSNLRRIKGLTLVVPPQDFLAVPGQCKNHLASVKGKFHRVVHKMFLPFFAFLFYPSMPKSGKLLKLDQGRDLGYKNQ